MLHLPILLLGQKLGDQGQLLPFLLLQDPLSGHWIVNSVPTKCLGVVNCVLTLGPILAEDAEARTAAESPECKRPQHDHQKDICLIFLLDCAQECHFLHGCGGECLTGAAIGDLGVKGVQSKGLFVTGVVQQRTADSRAFFLDDRVVRTDRVTFDLAEALKRRHKVVTT